MKLKTYQVIARDRVWHLTQRQARPPEKSELGCNTVCGVWANMKDGYERGMPTCSTCLRAITEYESKQPQGTTASVDIARVVRAPHFSVGSRRRRRGG